MRWVDVSLALLIGAFSLPASGQLPLVRIVAKHVPMDIFEIVDYSLQCPAGYVPLSYSVTPQYSYDVNEEQSRNLINPGGGAVSRDAITSAAQLDGAGYELTVFNTEHHAKNLEALVICVASAVSTDNVLRLVKSTGTAARGTVGTATSFCPADSPVAFAGFSTADGLHLRDADSAPVWGTSASPVLLTDVPDGATGPPTGWQMKVFNNLATGPNFAAYALCGKAPAGTQTFVYSADVPQGAFGFATSFSIFAPVPDGWSAVGTGYDLGPYGQYASSDMWVQDGNVVGALQWYDSTTGYDSAPAEVRAFIVRGGGNAPLSSAPTRGAVAVLAIPQAVAVPPPTIATVVEFYDATLDHFFITAIPDEIAKLDNGTFRGWARTGQTFKAYSAGSTGSTGRRPVCREYGQPDAGLDSHFYSASPDECMATMANTFGAWGIESSEVFQMDLPDPVTGACPSSDVPIYRVWNKRRDSNHRYTTSTAIRDQMVAKGGIAEGYGPNSVVFCGPP